MKTSAWILPLVIAASASAVAADKLSVQWNQLAQQVEGRRVTVTTSDPNSFRGRCLRVEYDWLVIENPWAAGQPLKLDRKKVVKIRVDDRGGRSLARLESHAGPTLELLLESVFTPMAPVGLVGTPVVAAYFVVATPFCLIGDMFARLRPPLDIDIVD